jgi:ketosteroid isomerase-like protein
MAAMSQNVDKLRKQYEAFNRRDWETAAELLDPHVELHGTVGGLEEDVVVRGPDGIRQQFEIEDDEVWEEHRIEPEKFIDAGEQVVVIQREYQRAKGSGVEIEGNTATVFDMRNGRIVRMQGYMDPAAALKAVGLSETLAGLRPR